MENPGQSQGSSFKHKVNAIVFVAEIFSMPVEMLMHKAVGVRYCRLRGFFAALIMSGIVVLFPAFPWWPMFAFIAIYWGRCIAHGIVWQIRLRNKVPLPDETTYFPGYPLITPVLPAHLRPKARWVEVIVVFFAGLFISILSMPLGTYLSLAALALALTLYLRYQAVLNRILDMHDSIVVNKNITDGFRERSRN